MKHVRRKHHEEMARAGTSSQSIISFRDSSKSVIEAEARWATFIAKHNIAFLASDHATLMDESNDKSDKSCIILVRVFDPILCDVRTRFLDMPVVNVGNAQNLFDALKLSLAGKGLDFSKAVAFMSDTTNVMKGARSGVQKLIKNENPTLYDVGCICHLADLTVKAGMSTLPLDIDQLFVDIFYFPQQQT